VAGGQLPARYPTDFQYDPGNDSRVWATFSGDGTGHVYESTDDGATWTDRSANLPDIPAQSVAIDPDYPQQVLVGTDLGIYRSTDGGLSWADFNTGMPIAMITDLVIHDASRTLRTATFGNGVWETGLPDPTATGATVTVAAAPGDGIELAGARPNPFRGVTAVEFSLGVPGEVRLTVHDASGRRVRTLADGQRAAGTGRVEWDGLDDAGRRVAAGVYFVNLEAAGTSRSAKMTVLR
jgi:hypothetical protein